MPGSSKPTTTPSLRDELLEAIRDPILLGIEREWNLIASVESTRMATEARDAALRVIRQGVVDSFAESLRAHGGRLDVVDVTRVLDGLFGV